MCRARSGAWWWNPPEQPEHLGRHGRAAPNRTRRGPRAPTLTVMGSTIGRLRELWDFDDPAGSERRFRRLAESSDGPSATYAWTQVARALGLQEKYDEAQALLDRLTADDAEAEVRIAMETARLLRSGGEESEALPHARRAAAAAEAAGLDELHVDALHMVALLVGPDARLAAHHAALDRARASEDPAARDWDATLLNNIGMQHVEAGDHPAALAAFEEALAARERIGDPARTRVARWMVAWSLRQLGRTGAALELQLELKAELDALGRRDPFVDEELAVLQDAR